MCPWISVRFPKYYSDVPRFAKSFLILLVFSLNSFVNKKYLAKFDTQFDLSKLDFISTEMLYTSLFSASISIVCWIFYCYLYRVSWLYQQELQYKSSLVSINENNKKKLFDKNLYLKNAFNELIFDIKTFRDDKAKLKSKRMSENDLLKSNLIQSENFKYDCLLL